MWCRTSPPNRTSPRATRPSESASGGVHGTDPDETTTCCRAAVLQPVGFRAGQFSARLPRSVAHAVAVLQRKNAEKRLLHASLHDALTGLPTRVLTHQLEAKVKAKSRRPCSMSTWIATS